MRAVNRKLAAEIRSHLNAFSVKGMLLLIALVFKAQRGSNQQSCKFVITRQRCTEKSINSFRLIVIISGFVFGKVIKCLQANFITVCNKTFMNEMLRIQVINLS